MRTLAAGIAVGILIPISMACTSPGVPLEGQREIEERARDLHALAPLTLERCAVEYAGHESDTECSIEDEANQLLWAMKQHGVDPQPLHEYLAVWNSVAAGVKVHGAEFQGGYSARQAANADKLRAAGERLVMTLRETK